MPPGTATVIVVSDSSPLSVSVTSTDTRVTSARSTHTLLDAPARPITISDAASVMSALEYRIAVVDSAHPASPKTKTNAPTTPNLAFTVSLPLPPHQAGPFAQRRNSTETHPTLARHPDRAWYEPVAASDRPVAAGRPVWARRFCSGRADAVNGFVSLSELRSR